MTAPLSRRSFPAMLFAFLLGPWQSEARGQPLEEVRKAYAALEELDREVTIRSAAGGERREWTGRALLRKPHFARLDLQGTAARTIVANSEDRWVVLPEEGYCLRSKAGAPRSIPLFGAKPLSLFFGDGFTFAQPVKPDEVRTVGTTRVGPSLCEVVEVVSEVFGEQKIRYFVGPDRLVHRMIAELTCAGISVRYEVELRPPSGPAPWPEKPFDFDPPADLRVQDEKNPQPVAAAGEPCPKFGLLDLEGNRISLSELARKHRAVVVDFWFLNCAPCLAEFPQLDRMGRALAEQGVAVVAVNGSDSATEIRAFRERQDYDFTFATAGLRGVHGKLLGIEPFGLVEAWGLRSYPTTVLLDSKGHIVLRCAGYNPEELRPALAKLGVTWRDAK